jgi:type II secretion system (T2SS) protein E
MGKLGQLLVARGWITVQQLTRALKNQTVAGGRLGTCLIEMDAIGEDLLLKGLSEQLGVPRADADDLRAIPEEVLALIPEKLARRCRAVPFSAMGGRLDVAMIEPRNLAAQDEIAFASGKRVKVHVAHELRIFEALEKYYGEECPSRFTLLLDRLNRARFLWERAAPATGTETGDEPPSSPAVDLYGAPPRMAAPPLPEPALPPTPRRAHAAAPPPRPPAATAAGSPAARPASAPRPLSVSLTPEERAELAAAPEPAPPGAAAAPPVASPPPRVAPAAPPPPPAAAQRAMPPTTLAEAEEALATTRDREEVARIALGFLARHHRRAALFHVNKDRVSGWMAAGEGVDAAAFGRFNLSFDQPSLFLNLRQGSGLHIGPMAPMPAHRELARTWGGDLPRDCILLPVRMKERLVAVLYADGARRGAGGIDLPGLQRLTAATTAAFERCILYKKQADTRS